MCTSVARALDWCSVLPDCVVKGHTSTMSTAGEPIFKKNTSGDLSAVLEAMKKQFMTLEQERAVIRTRIVVVRQTLKGLVTVFGRRAIGSDLRYVVRDSRRSGCKPGLTSTCAQLLVESSRTLTVAELLTIMQDKYPSLFSHNNNPKASLATVLGRLSTYGTVQPVLKAGARAWRAAPQLATADPSLPAPNVKATHTIRPASGTQPIAIGPNTRVTSELTRACRIALLESREAAPEEVYARIVRRASFSFNGIERPVAAIARVLEILAEEERLE